MKLKCQVWLDKSHKMFRLEKIDGDPLVEILACKNAHAFFGNVPTNPDNPKQGTLTWEEFLPHGY